MGESLLDLGRLADIANLPTKEEAIAQFLGLLNAPVSKLVSLANEIPTKLTRTILALKQAKKNLGNTKENPSVGCVIVKNNCVVSADSTSFNGRPHAEQNAIKTSRNNVNNSTLYVTLEPCSNFGKTPPCVNTIIKNNVII